MTAIAFAALGEARTTRQGRGMAVAAAILAVIALRIAGFATTSAAGRSDLAVVVVWILSSRRDRRKPRLQLSTAPRNPAPFFSVGSLSQRLPEAAAAPGAERAG